MATDRTRRAIAGRYGALSCHAEGPWRTIETLGVNLLDDPVVGGIVATYRDVIEARRREGHPRFPVAPICPLSWSFSPYIPIFWQSPRESAGKLPRTG